MNKLPEGLELAENLCSHAWSEGRCSTEQIELAISAIRSEHDQRLTLQHHAADLAQRVADLEKERDELRSMFYSECQASAAFAVALGLDETENDPPNITDAIEELTAERDELRARLASNATPEGWKLVPVELLARCLSQLESDWHQIDGEWGPSHGGLEGSIASGCANEIRDLRATIAAAPEHKA